MDIKFDLNEAIFPIAVAVVLVTLITQIRSCSSSDRQLKNDQVQIYLDSGCEKKSIIGVAGTEWVCGDKEQTEVIKTLQEK